MPLPFYITKVHYSVRKENKLKYKLNPDDKRGRGEALYLEASRLASTSFCILTYSNSLKQGSWTIHHTQQMH